MNNDFFLLLAGAIVGFISAVSVELIRQRIEKKRKKAEWEYETNQTREKNIRTFLEASYLRKETPLAWIKLVETGSSSDRKKNMMTDYPKIPSLFYRLTSSTRGIYIQNRAIGKYILARTQIIGRQEDCEIFLDDKTVSRLHAMLRYDKGEFIIYDLGSGAGTLVNDNPVPSSGKNLVNGDKITVGKSVFLFEETESVGRQKSESKRKKNDLETTIKMNTKKSKSRRKN